MKPKSILKKAFSLALTLSLFMACVPAFAPQQAKAANTARQMESLDRGLVAVNTSNGVFLSWRLLGTESYSTTFNIYRDGNLIAGGIATSTNYLDGSGSDASSYYVRSVTNGTETTQSATVTPWGQNYMDVPLQKPANITMDGTTVTYAANDATVADVDGDGAYEIILKWDPSNSKDNSQSGYTGNVYVDCYEMNGTLRWRIDLGRNIRAGAHYTQIIAYDLNGDGKAEVAMKTADGTIAGDGTVIGDASKDYRNSSGYILSGPEYLTLFDGRTGAVLTTIDYNPERGTVSSWGDSYGNRVDRFLAGVAYFDGKTPSLVICRGYYTRAVIVSYEYKGGKLNQEWIFDSNDSGNSAYAGEGNHNLSIADVDGDGFDEIVYGSAVIDHNGKGLYATGHGHGDALHVSDFDPDRPGLEIYQVHEEKGSSIESVQFRDAATGETIWGKKLQADTGRGLILNIDPDFYPYATLASGSQYFTRDGVAITGDIKGLGINFATYWDGDLYREGLDGTTVRKWDYNNDKVVTVLTGSNVHSNNSTKSTPSLSGDILGDWREEVIWPTSDDTALRIYTTTDITDAKLYTLMHDSQYRCAIAWQNVAYNQPPHTSYFIGPTMATPTQPSIYTVGSFSLAAPDGSGSSSGGTTSSTTPSTTAGSSGTVTAGSFVHNFTENGKTSDFYTITGNTSTSKGTASYAGLTLSTCLKMESSTNISFTAPSAGTLTLVFGGSTAAAGKTVKIDGTKYTADSNGIVTQSITSGSHTIAKGDSINLFYIVYTPEGGSGGEAHTHSYSTHVTAATCTSQGYTTYSCTCGNSYVSDYVSALGHSYSGSSCVRCGASNPNSGVTTSRVTVHDPSVVEANGWYYIFGSHRAWAKSQDLQNWVSFTTNLDTDYATIFASNAAWAANGTSGTYDVSGNMWAPDVIYNEAMGKWCMYMSINGDNYYSSIALATADAIEGPYTYRGTVVYSGFDNSDQAADTDFKTVTGSNSVPSRYLTNGSWNPQYGTNAIDPCVFYDENGQLWMVYGSWFGGLFMLKLDESTGLRDYSYTYATSTNASDEYLGIKISGGYGCTGEGPYIVYDSETDYYYLYISYGGLNATDDFSNYNMRLFRSKTVTGPYVDAAGNSAICYSASEDQTVKGIKLMGNYSFSSLSGVASGEGSANGYKSPGHNSAIVDSKGNRYLVYHTRFNGGSEWHQVRVHQQFLNADGWPVTAVYEYLGDNISGNYADSELVGHYEFVNHGSTAVAYNAGMLTTQNIVLNSNGTITGDVTGTWSHTAGTYYCTMLIDGVTYKGVFFKQKDESASHNTVMTFSAIGDNNQSIWGSQTKAEPSGWIIDSPAWWSNHSDAVQITSNIQSWSFTATSYASAADNWDTPSVLVYRSDDGKVDGSNYLMELLVRSDSYAVSEEYTWGTDGQESFSTKNYPADWAAWLSANQAGASCTVTAQLVGDRIIVALSNNGVVNVYSVPKNTGYSGPVYLSITGEESTMTGWTSTSNHLDISAAVAAANGSSAHTHSYSSAVTAATCTSQGYTTYTCSCGASYVSDYVSALGHSYAEGVCTRCGAKDPSYVAPTEPPVVTPASAEIHNFTENGKTSDFYTITGNTSTSKGSVSYDGKNLTICLKMESSTNISFTAPASGTLTLVFGGSTAAAGKSVKIDGTSYDVGSDGTIPVAVASGAHTVTKGDSINLFYMVYTPEGSSTEPAPHEHSYTSSVTTAATCETAGVRTYVCQCGDSYTEAIAALGHSYQSVVTAPTCTANGYTTYTCATCGHSYTGNQTSATGHSYTFEEIYPNCTTDGYIVYSCSACGHSYTEAGTPSQGHFYGNGTCTYCGEKDPNYHEHSYTSSVIAPTCEAEGVRTYLCACGDTYSEVIASLGHSFADGMCAVCGVQDPNLVVPQPEKNGISKAEDGNFYYYVDGEVATSFTGLADNSVGTWYILNGQVQTSYDGLITYEGTKYDIKAGMVSGYDGLKKMEGVWLYFDGGVNDVAFEGLSVKNGMACYVQNGEINFNKTDIIDDNGVLKYVKYGIFRNTLDGLVKGSDGVWRYVEDGVFTGTYEGLAKNAAGWWYIKNSLVDTTFTGLGRNHVGQWYVKWGQPQVSYTGTVTFDGVTYSIKNGLVQ